MRWDNLFEDLEGQLEHELVADDQQLRVEEERLRLGRLTLRDRLLAASGGDARSRPVQLWLRDGGMVRVRPVTFGRDWVSGDLEAEPGRPIAAPVRVLVPLDAIVSVLLDAVQLTGSLEAAAPDAAAAAAPRLIDRLGIAFALRDLARRRSSVTVTTRGERLHGTVDRVASDHFDLALHDPGEPRRDSEVRGIRIVPMSAVVFVRM